MRSAGLGTERQWPGVRILNWRCCVPCGAFLNFCVLTSSRCPLPLAPCPLPLTAAFLLLIYLHDFLDRGRRSDRPARGYEGQAIGAAQDCESDYQAYFLCDCSYC